MSMSVNIPVLQPAAKPTYSSGGTAGIDSDGDHDGSKPGDTDGAAAATTPPPSNPTATVGNNVNTYA